MMSSLASKTSWVLGLSFRDMEGILGLSFRDLEGGLRS